MNDTKAVYMAGSVHHADDGGHGWRDWIEQEYPDFEWVNPLDKYDGNANDIIVQRENCPRGIATTSEMEIVSSAQIVESDKRMILDCDAVLVGWDPSVPACGTPMEVMFAWEQGIPVVVWLRGGQPDLADVSPWLDYHADRIETDVEDCLDYIDGILTSVRPEI